MVAFENLSREELISELTSLSQKYFQSEKTLSEYQFRILKFETELAQLRRLIYGSKSERFVPIVAREQMALALEVEQVAAKPAVLQSITYTREKKQSGNTIRTGRMPLPAHLERKKIIIEPTEDVSGLKVIGEEITEELEYKAGSLFVNQYVRPKYEKPGKEGVLIGTLPSRPIEKGIPGPGLLANIIIDKYVYHLPCHRQIQRFEQLGVKIPASTMSEWISAGCTLLYPLYEVLKKEVLNGSYIQADETPIKVLDKNKKGTTHRGYYWVYHSPLTGMVLFEYKPGRGRDGPREMLKDFKGHLQTDGYGVYEDLSNKDIISMCCMAHARREFDKALSNDKPKAEQALNLFQELYALERIARDGRFSHEQRLKLRQEKSIPLLQELEQWLKNTIIDPQVTPKSTIGKAIAYSLSRWEQLSIYASNGALEIDNNLVENSIRPVAIGRKNYLFAGSHEAAQRAAMLYSFLGTCKKQNVDPLEWLKEIFSKIADHKANRLYELLPGKLALSPLQK